jgi:hypothetical protein
MRYDGLDAVSRVTEPMPWLLTGPPPTSSGNCSLSAVATIAINHSSN